MKLLAFIKTYLNQILRGVVIGVANIIPGVSGGTMMVSMGVYDTLIHSITHLFKEFWKSIKALLPYVIGMLIGILAFASLISWGLEHYELPTNTLFIGLILGGLSPLIKKIDRKKINAAAVIAFVVLFALIIWLGLQNRDSIQNAETIEMNVGQMFIMVLLGMIASGTMIIPGVSGSLVLMLLGYYKAVTGALKTVAHGLTHFEFSTLGQPVMMLLPFLLGIVLGIFGVAKLIEWLTAKYPTATYCGVLGLVVASPIALLIQTHLAGTSLALAAVSVATFLVGFIIAWLLAKGSKE
ncbi:MAG: DUF368 domain-containing protein [Clostridia bacterium]|nr:DUF368 domain-containing protein [Clostridia bacterium]